MIDRPSSGPSIETLLSSLDYESSIVLKDIAACLRSIWTLPRADQDRVVAIIQSPRLRSWITASHSSVLFLNANFKGTRRLQAASFVSAKLVDSAQPGEIERGQQSNVISLTFFCGEHLNSEDPDRGVHGMMRSIIGQLLLSYEGFDTSNIQTWTKVDYNDVELLCSMFNGLVSQLPAHMIVFCVLDSIAPFEKKRSLLEESTLVVQKLVDMVDRPRDCCCTFKLLLTSQWTSHELYMIVDSRDVVWMPAKVPAQGGFTALKWSSSIGASIDRLASM